MRLFNGDPDQERNKQVARQNYKKELEKQMIEDKMRKEAEKRRREEEDLKYEQQFYRDIAKKKSGEAGSPQREQKNPQRQVEQFPRRQQKIRSSSDKQIGQSFKQTSILTQKQQNPFNQMMPAFFQSLIGPKSPPSQPIVFTPSEPNFQQQRMWSIQSFQSSILKKVDDIKSQINRASSNALETKRQIDRIRNLITSKPLAIFQGVAPYSITSSPAIHKTQSLPTQPRKSVLRKNSPEPIKNHSDEYRKLDSMTEIKYPEVERQPQQMVPQSFNRLPQMKSESSQAEQEEYDKVQVPDLQFKFQKSPSKQINKQSIFASREVRKVDRSLDNAKFVPKSDIIDYRIENMLSNIDNLIEHYERN